MKLEDINKQPMPPPKKKQLDRTITEINILIYLSNFSEKKNLTFTVYQALIKI